MSGPRLYDVNKRENDFKSIYPALDEMSEKDEIETAVISIVKRDGEIITLKFGLATAKEAQSAVGALEVAKTAIVSDILLANMRAGG